MPLSTVVRRLTISTARNMSWRAPYIVAAGLLILVKSSSSFLHDDEAVRPAKIAIIGGGIGGTSAAYFLKELFGDDAILDLYESETIGGRLATIPIAGNIYEVGGSVIHPQNEYMVNFVKELGLAKKVDDCELRAGLFNGEDYVFRDSPWTVVTLARLFMRYGWDVYRLDRLTKDMLGKFGRIYRLQEEGNAYEDVGSLLEAMDPSFLEMTHSSAATWLRGLGFHDLMINELVMAVTQCNYGQTPSLHAFVGSIAVAGADGDLWAVEGGNKRVPEELLKASRAAMLKRSVTEISPDGNGQFLVTSVDAEISVNKLFKEGDSVRVPLIADELSRSQSYDLVIIATPLTEDKSRIRFTNFTEEFQFPGRYERIVCTMVEGKLRPESVKADFDDLDEILVTNPRLIFNSIGRQLPVTVTNCSEKYPDVWKIFSPKPLPEDQLKILFDKRKSVDVIDWLAYPHYESNQPLSKFVITPGIYHVNAIEWAGSAMEMEIIGGKNAALLAYKHWKQDPNAGKKSVKDEL